MAPVVPGEFDIVPEEFEVVQLGEAGDLDLIPLDSSSSIVPKLTLPFGLPPVLPDLNSQLEEFLDHPEKLPIHDLDRVQKFIPRTPCVSSLLSIDVSPLQTTLQVERDPNTGKLLGFREVKTSSSNATSKNSTSLRRAPGAPADSVRGSSSSLPFWPGGMEEPDTENLKYELLRQDINFEKDLLTTPPGFKEGMIFPSSYKPASQPELSVQGPSFVNLDDIWALEDAIDLGTIAPKEEPKLTKLEEKKIEIVKAPPPPPPVSISAEETEEVERVLHSAPSTTVLQISKAPSGPQMASTTWAHLVDVTQPVKDFHKKIPNMAKTWPFELDVFQKQAILHLEKNDSVFVAAHTSAGKTVPAEYAIALCKQHMTKVVYTSPIKALSNQKYRDFKQTFGDVGLITGDVQINATAFCLIMTTEILRSMLYHGSEIIRDVEWAIFDEVHYINDKERGVVWEEVLIMLPDHINLILLSATVSNIMKFADWLGAIKKKKIYVIRTLTRPVPLEHFLYTGSVGKSQDERFLIIDSNSRLQKSGYQLALDAKKSRESKGKQTQGAKGPRYMVASKQEKNIYLGLINHLKDNDKLPVVCFILSRKGIDEKVLMMASLDLTTKEEKNEIHNFMHTSISKLKESDRKLLQISIMKKLLVKGLGVHHSGILPILKEVVEMLFQRGLVKVLFATETFAMGINMPARTVVFDSIQKYDGKSKRDLNSSEYIQMAGRAGRRGHDKTGTVIILCKGDIPEISSLQNMMMGKPENLSSQFRLTYSMILNLKLQQSSIKVEDMMKRSFAEASVNQNVDYKKLLEQSTSKLSSLRRPNCSVCDGDIKKYCKSLKEFHNLRKKILGELVTDRILAPGRLILVATSFHQNVAGVILSGTVSGKDKSLKVLTIAEGSEKEANLSIAMQRPGGHLESGDSNKGRDNKNIMPVVMPWTRELFFPEDSWGHNVIDITTDDIQTICTKTIKIEPDKVINNWKKRQQPRFLNDPPNQATSMAVQELYSFVEANEEGVEELNLVKELHISGVDKLEQMAKLKNLVNCLDDFACLKCPYFSEHFTLMNELLAVEEKIDFCKLKLSEESLALHSEYKQRLQVLKRLEYINDKEIVQLKGKVAREIHNHELLLTELLVRNVLNNRHPEEIAALLSCVVFPQRGNSDKLLPKLDASLTKGMEAVLEVIDDIDKLQTECQVYDEDFAAQYNFDLADAVHKWAKGMPFVEIMEIEGVQKIAQEGIIVRCIQRLNDTLKDLKNAAKLVGEPTLMEKMVQASHLIKRDIVFAASLYTQ